MYRLFRFLYLKPLGSPGAISFFFPLLCGPELKTRDKHRSSATEIISNFSHDQHLETLHNDHAGRGQANLSWVLVVFPYKNLLSNISELWNLLYFSVFQGCSSFYWWKRNVFPKCQYYFLPACTVFLFCFVVFLFLHSGNVHIQVERSVSDVEEKTQKKATAQVHLLLFN